MRPVSGRVKVVAVVVTGALLLVAAMRPAAQAWLESQAARQAVAASLRGLAQAEVAPALELPGVPATAEEAQAMDEVVRAYLMALHERDYEAAWQLTAPDTVGVWTLDSWRDLREGFRWASGEDRGRDADLISLMLGHKLSLGEVHTWGEAGVCRVIVNDVLPAAVALVRTDAGWMVDLKQTDDYQARLVVGRQLRSVGEGFGQDNFLGMMMVADGDYVPPNYLDTLGLPVSELDYAVQARSVDGDRAAVRLEGRINMHLKVPLANGDQGWSIAWCRGAQVMSPDETLTPPDAEKLVGIASREACASNLKQLMLGMLMYCQDYDERMPIADRWCGATYPYIKNEAIHHCPADGGYAYSYAMNYKLSRQHMGAAVYPAELVSLFESSLHRPDAYDKGDLPGASLALPPRHGEVNNYGYADGHVASRQPEQMPLDRYRLQPEDRRYGPGGYPGGPPMGPAVPPPPPPPPVR